MNYLERAKDDIYTAKLLLSPVGNPNNDEGKFDIAAYHTQQAAEKGLKFLLHDLYGEDDEDKRFRTHDISFLIRLAESKGSYIIPDELKIISVDLTMWEAQSRYSDSSIAKKNEIQDASEICERFLTSLESIVK